MTRPDIRVSPIRDSYARLVRTVLEARNPKADDEAGGGELQPGEMALILDGGKHGNKSKLTGPWRKENYKDKADDDDADDDLVDDEDGSNVGLVPSLLQLVKTEESLSAWKKRIAAQLLVLSRWSGHMSCQLVGSPCLRSIASITEAPIAATRSLI